MRLALSAATRKKQSSMFGRVSIQCLAAILLVAFASPSGACASDAADSADFESQILPILARRCGECHRSELSKGGLDLSSLAALRRGGESGETMLASSLSESRLWQVIEENEMPPNDKTPLSERETTLLREWMEAAIRTMERDGQPTKSRTQHDVLPIVLLRCTTCHGAQLRQGGLDLRTRKGMLVGGKSGPAISLGDPDASLMIRRVESHACPPQNQLLKFFVRRPPKSEVAVLRDWIAAGAPQVANQPDVSTLANDPLVSDLDRQHWAFVPPKVTSPSRSIDHYVSKSLAQIGLALSDEASRDTLIRRVHFDLIGLPPSTEQWQRWRSSESPNWYSSMIDELLASPHYGERWGRYWLDLAGYADSEGGVSADPVRPVAWKYRDYVIESFNEDKPYDRFLQEQLAGDEMIDHASADNVTDEMVSNLIATGFLRMGIDETGSRTMNFVPERLKVIGDAISVVSSGVMGLTMECARCHSHKYDPIPHRDYYRFKAIFQGALDEHDWSSFKTRKLNVATKRHRQEAARVNPPLEAEVKKLQARQKRLTGEIQLELLRHHYPTQSESENGQTLRALKIADNNRTLPQKVLVERLQIAELLPQEDQPESVRTARSELRRLEREADHIRARMVAPLSIRALWDRGRPSPTYVLRRGEHDKPGAPVGPGVPSLFGDVNDSFEIRAPFPGGSANTGRRSALAHWLTQADHPLTARVMVNRIWHHHFGVGIVSSLDNFGVQGERPSHPELLDWLAIEFVRRGWSVKEMHRLMMNSSTYRQHSRVSEMATELDPENRLLSRMPIRRLDAESLRDSLLFVSGRLDNRPGGIPDSVSVDRDGLVLANPTEGGGWRRSIYMQYRRTEIPTLMEAFDYPKMGPNCIVRNVSIVSPQSLMLMNDRHVRDLAAAFARRVEARVAADDSPWEHTQIVDEVFKLALSRLPSDEEKKLGVAALRQLESVAGVNANQALETFCHTILNSAAFLYID